MKSKSTPRRLEGKVALITGGNQGIGLAIAAALATEGCNLVISGRNESTLKQAAKTLARHDVQTMTVACDVRSESSVASLVAGAKKWFRRVDILINNAGVAHANFPIAELPLKDWRAVIDTNLTGMFLVTQAALPLMKRGGTIVNNLSVSAKTAFPGMAGYTAAKHGGLGFTKTLREELWPKKIRVIALLAGATRTDIWDSFWADAPREKMMSAESVAEAVVSAILLPPESTIEELVIRPTGGSL
jgi:NAD(P)-dependent dehydrogenase (short-subunit alcohol dehydrogenase family)